MDLKEQLNLFLEPESVAFIGASRTTGPGSFNAVENMLELGYEGEVYPVNPKADEILGLKAYDRVSEISEDIDLAVISIPRNLVLDVVEECGSEGIKALIIITQGFAESDEKGKELQEKLVQKAGDYGARILGPNTMGVFNYNIDFSTSFVPFKRMDWGPIGLVSQTGLFFAGFPDFQCAKAIDIGNTCDIDHFDVLKYFKEDPEIEQIFLHIEGLREGKEFLELAKEVTEEKPVIALKAGSSESGKKAAESHTGSMTGQDRIYQGVFAQTGIIRVEDSIQLQTVSKALLNFPKMNGNQIAVITHAGAGGIMAADAAEKFGLELADLSEETIEKIKSLSPKWMDIGNPVDIWPGMMIKGPEILEVSFDSVFGEDSVDGVIGVFPNSDSTTYPEEEFGGIFDILEESASENDKPLAVWLQGAEQEWTRKKLDSSKNIAVFDSINEAARALSIVKNYK